MKKVLVVEDNQVVASMYRSIFQTEGINVEIAVDGEKGLEMIRRIKPDLVLLDLMLPKISGVEILQQVRAQPEFSALPIIVFSGSYQSEKAYQAGATQVLSKASNPPKKIVELVMNLLASSPAPSPPALPPTPSQPSPSQPSPSQPLPVSAASTMPAARDDSDAHFQLELRKTLLDSAPETLSVLRSLLQACVNGTGDANHLLDLYLKVHSLSGNAGLSGLPRIAMMAAALEALLKEICDKPKQINPAVLRTMSQAIDSLPTLFEQGGQVAEPDVSSAHVLVVDDEEIGRRAMSYGLEKANLRALRVGDSATAMGVLKENRFDLVLLDIQMPGVNGFELCAKLRAMPLHEKTPVVFVTSMTDYEQHVQYALSGGNDFIVKPFLYTELLVKVLVFILKGPLGTVSTRS